LEDIIYYKLLDITIFENITNFGMLHNTLDIYRDKNTSIRQDSTHKLLQIQKVYAFYKKA